VKFIYDFCYFGVIIPATMAGVTTPYRAIAMTGNQEDDIVASTAQRHRGDKGDEVVAARWQENEAGSTVGLASSIAHD
jgi:hypothetical protein